MSQHPTTCWSVLEGAARGDAGARRIFAARYESVIRAYLAARWRGSRFAQDLDDAVQEAFLEVFREGGVLERVEPGRPGGFRAFFYGVLRHIALRHESKAARRRERAAETAALDNAAIPSEEHLTRVFDQQWARAVMREAADLQRERARTTGPDAMRRVELLQLRFHDGLPIREIAERWKDDPAHVHREYARARREFRAALEEVVATHQPGEAATAPQRCAELLSLL